MTPAGWPGAVGSGSFLPEVVKLHKLALKKKKNGEESHLGEAE